MKRIRIIIALLLFLFLSHAYANTLISGALKPRDVALSYSGIVVVADYQFPKRTYIAQDLFMSDLKIVKSTKPFDLHNYSGINLRGILAPGFFNTQNSYSFQLSFENKLFLAPKDWLAGKFKPLSGTVYIAEPNKKYLQISGTIKTEVNKTLITSNDPSFSFHFDNFETLIFSVKKELPIYIELLD